MSKDAFRDALSRLSLTDIAVDDSGRIVIANDEIARELANATKGPPGGLAEATNYGCCTNGALCGKQAQLPSVTERFVTPAKP